MDATENAQPHVRAERQVILGRRHPIANVSELARDG
jgi:hypothetical protein